MLNKFVLILFRAGRGNIFLESAVPLTKSLHRQIISLGQRIDETVNIEQGVAQSDNAQRLTSKPITINLASIINDMKSLLYRIDCEIPLLQLAISASGESLATSLPAGVSPSRLLQASTLLVFGDMQYTQNPTMLVQVGPTFKFSVYMLFRGHGPTTGKYADESTTEENSPSQEPYGLGAGQRKPIWQEVIHKARVRLCRNTYEEYHGGRQVSKVLLPHIDSDCAYSYHLEIIEDLDDGRVHDIDGLSPSENDTSGKHICESIPIHQLSKLFYADTGRILNIGDSAGEGNPVLLLKRDPEALPSWQTSEANKVPKAVPEENDDTLSVQSDIDRQLFSEFCDGTTSSACCDVPGAKRFPLHVDPEWIAFEVFEDDYDDDDSSIMETAVGDAQTRNTSTTSPSAGQHSSSESPQPQQKGMADSTLADKLTNMSVTLDESTMRQFSQSKEQTAATSGFGDSAEQSPFKSITTSLSLIEMLIRLAGLQEFQQASHLTIPDHILAFFLEETSTTGATGDMRWNLRREAKQRVGFDPYTDAPSG